ncbi:MAG: sensor histidine kinase [Brotaphodocola sp.]
MKEKWKQKMDRCFAWSHSIRHRIMLLFVAMMTFMLLAIWALNNWWLERYYVNQKLKVMEQAYTKINEAVMERVNAGENIADVIADEIAQEWESWGESTRPNSRYPQDTLPPSRKSKDGSEKNEYAAGGSVPDSEAEKPVTLLGTIRAFGERNNVTIVLIDSTTGKTFLNFGRINDFLAQKVQRYILGQSDNRAQTLVERENYVVEMNYDFRSSNMYMESWGFFSDNQTLFIMSMPLASIRESASLSNRFITYVGLVVLLFGSILMYFVTNRVTKPIMELSHLSERMSRLDFDVSYEDDANDEIGVLGRSMNTLSNKLKETIEALREANVQLQHDIEEKIKIDEMRKEFVANVSHELKTPIALIQGYAEGLSEGMCEDEESRNYYCEVIVDEAAKMNTMVKQLLNLSALESGNDAPVMSMFDVNELIRDVISSAGILIQQKDAQVIFGQKGILYVIADEFKIEEVLTNYLNNAMNHLDGERQIRIQTECLGEQVKVSVFNSGNPIPEEDIPNLWSKFYKVDKARTRTYGGSGIGLSIVKAIMDAHHQEYGVENQEDGVEFWFTLAAAQGPFIFS